MQAPLTTIDAPAEKRAMKGWHALVWFLGFFGFMFAVNGIFLWTAITTFPGEDVDKSYLAGIDYNQELARRVHQKESGWHAEIGSERIGSAVVLTVRLLTSNGSALPSFETEALLRHPANRNLDRALSMTASGGGEYVATFENLSAGAWNVELTADIDPEAAGHEFRASREVLVP